MRAMRGSAIGASADGIVGLSEDLRLAWIELPLDPADDDVVGVGEHEAFGGGDDEAVRVHPRFGEMNRPSVGQEVGAVRVAPCEGVRLPERASPEGEVVVVDAGPADRLDLDWLLAVPAQVSHRSLRERRAGRRSWLASPRSGPVVPSGWCS